MTLYSSNLWDAPEPEPKTLDDFLKLLKFDFNLAFKVYYSLGDEGLHRLVVCSHLELRYIRLNSHSFTYPWKLEDGFEEILTLLIEQDYAPAINYRRKRNLSLLLGDDDRGIPYFA